nr:hypothetical protein [Acetobacter musti]
MAASIVTTPARRITKMEPDAITPDAPVTADFSWSCWPSGWQEHIMSIVIDPPSPTYFVPGQGDALRRDAIKEPCVASPGVRERTMAYRGRPPITTKSSVR